MAQRRSLAPVAVILLGLAAGCTSFDAGTLPPVPGGDADPGPQGWHTEGQKIIDPQGRQRILQGINLSNDAKPPPYDSWAVAEDYARLQQWGFSTIRLLTGWAAIMPEPGVISETYLIEYERRVAWAAAHNLLVVIDLHQDIFGEGFGHNGAPRWACDEDVYATYEAQDPWFINYFSPEVQECFGRLWTDEELQDHLITATATIAGRYADRENVIGIDLFNEPMFGDTAKGKNFERDQLQPFYNRLIPAIREQAPEILIFAEPFVGFQLLRDTDLEPFDFDNVIFAPHFYQPSVHDDRTYDGDPTYVQETFAYYQAAAEALGVPWWLGEWGGPSSTTNFPAYLRDVLTETEKYGAATSLWSYQTDDTGFGPLNSDHSEKTEVLDVLARVYPKAIGGELISFRFEDETKVFTIRLETLDGVEAPTILAFPELRHYPDGFVIESSDAEGSWSWETNPDLAELTFTIDRSAVEHLITISPAS